MVKRPIDSFVKYFLDVKPYHTKILEIVERYLIDEEVNVSIKENIFFTEEWGNEPLCKGVGYGLDFDDDCGFSSLSCCDLFDCIGGYGLIFDNSDLLVDAAVADTPPQYYDSEAGTITVVGDRRYDTYYQIDSVTPSSFLIRGNHVSAIAPHSLFVVVPKSTYLVQETVFNGFYISGNVAQQFNAANEFTLINSTANDDIYSVVEAIYYSDAGRTFVKVAREDLNINALGQIIVDSGTKNNGAYQKDSVFFNGTHTVIQLHTDSQQVLMHGEAKHGSVVLRTGFIAGRRVWLNNGQTTWDATYDEENELVTPATTFPTVSEAKILDVSYSENDAATTITIEVANNVRANVVGVAPDEELELTDSEVALDFSEVTSVQLRGYYFGAGYDGLEECTTPKPYHVYTSISEFLSIEVISYAPPPPDLIYFSLLTDKYEPEPLPPEPHT